MSKLRSVAQRLKESLGEKEEQPAPNSALTETLDLLEKYSKEIRDGMESKRLSEHYRVKLAIALGLIREVNIYLSDEE